MDYDLKNTPYSKGTMLLRSFLILNGHYISKGTMILRTLLIPDG